MSAATPEPVAQWLLLDVPQAPQALMTLHRGFAGVRRFWLFEGTEFQPVREQGPLLIELQGNAALAALCQRDPQIWSGLLLGSESAAPVLLEHLRRMLTVSFGLQHRALLTWYNRQTASYFFDACDAGELSRWLGPIQQLRWFGGTWADLAMGSQGWQQLRNPRLAVEPLRVDESLTSRQRERLQACLLDQHIWRWCQAVGADFPVLAAHVQQGLALGFGERAMLDGWLWLRLQYPRATWVPPPAGLTPQERLEHLRRQWQGDQP
ncbi:DUF4123 domain-containing protein [Pseudomonas koreensis]|uniref:DUF4123 domain-containing protein n=1 Tax=Pseudomonas koreensis TaxID=198620 RepID=A0A9X3BDP0_9PSED|nr:DUF4123 domain-containing protein [Pseudomonas koreensis]MCU7249498.1 DUF4123 domain-containing protein [Pseudomonas koreensis]